MYRKCEQLHIFDTCFVQIYTFSAHQANIIAKIRHYKREKTKKI